MSQCDAGRRELEIRCYVFLFVGCRWHTNHESVVLCKPYISVE
jgi:hypothetical protein